MDGTLVPVERAPLEQDQLDQDDGNSRRGPGVLLLTLAGMLLSLISLGAILYQLFLTDDDEAADSSEFVTTVSQPGIEEGVATTAASSTTTTPSTTTPSTTTPPTTTTALPTTASTTSPRSTTTASSAASADDEPPQISGLEVDVGSTTANVSFDTNTCVNARYDYSGPTTGRHEGAGYPDARQCWTEHRAFLGEWTDKLDPGATYQLDVTVIDLEGRTATTTIDFTTSG